MSSWAWGRAVSLYRSYFRREPGKKEIVRLALDGEGVGVVIGLVDKIQYSPTGDADSYMHEFEQAGRPSLVVSFDGKEAYLIGGSFRFTDRGFIG